MRGYQKRVVFLENPRSSIFEGAYFIIKDDSDGEPSENIVNEALRIIEENQCAKESLVYAKKNRTPRGFLNFLVFGVGFFSATLIFIGVMLL